MATPIEIERQEQMRNSIGNSSIASESCGNLADIEDELMATPRKSDSSITSRNTSMRNNDEADEVMYVAVGKEYKESKSTVIWALRNNRRIKKFVLLHIHCPGKMIPIMGAWFQESQLKTEQVEAYRLQEREKMNRTLDEYLFICDIAKVQAEKLVIEMDDVAKGIIELIAQHGISKLVMGAAADKYYSKKMRAPASKTAYAVLKEAPSSCDIWFVCKGNLICTRDVSHELDGISQPATPRTRSSKIELPKSKSASRTSLLSDTLQDLDHMQESSTTDSSSGQTMALLQEADADRAASPEKLLSTDSLIDLQERDLCDPQASDSCVHAEGGDDEESQFSSSSTPMDEGCKSDSLAVVLHSPHLSEEDAHLSSAQDPDNLKVDDDWNVHLQQAITEAAKLVNGAYRESRRRCRAEREALEANNRAKAYEMKYAKEIKQREEIEKSLSQETMEMEKLQKRLSCVLEELHESHRQNAMLEAKVTESDHQVKSLEEKLSASRQLLDSIQHERNELQRERDNAIREVEVLRQTREEPSSSSTCRSPNFLEFSYLELEQASCNFENSLKIGEGGYGCVYKGFLRHTTVAIKMLHRHGLHVRTEFRQEVENLSRLRHPNLVTLIGACSEERALVYEFLPNGSLEDHLVCNDKAKSLPWQVRARISAEICSALIFLHSNKPQSVVHGDLRPANILLDTNYVSKVTDFGIGRLLVQSTATFYNWADPKGTFVYMDPEFFSTGELTTRSDIYSFGIILLRILTGKPALGIVKEVQEALEKGRLQTILDPTAGDWPFVLAQQLAHLGLRCCEMKRKSRPDLVRDVWKIFEAMKVTVSPLPAASGSTAGQETSNLLYPKGSSLNACRK